MTTLADTASLAQTIALWAAVALIAAALTMLGVVLLGLWRARQTGTPFSLGSLFGGPRQPSVPEAERLLKAMVEAEELTKKLSAQLDQRAARLEGLMRQAEQMLVQLERRPQGRTPLVPATPEAAVHGARRAGEMDEVAPVQPSSPLASRAIAAEPPAELRQAPARPEPARVVTLTNRIPAPSAAGSAPAAPRMQSRPVTTPPSPAPRPPQVDEVQRRICELADQGVSPVEIAQQTGQHVGKVELILALRQP